MATSSTVMVQKGPLALLCYRRTYTHLQPAAARSMAILFGVCSDLSWLVAEADDPHVVASRQRTNDLWAPALTVVAGMHALLTGKAIAQGCIRLALAAMPGIADHYPFFYSQVLQNAFTAEQLVNVDRHKLASH